MKNKILFIGSFILPENGYYGGVYQASVSLRDALSKKGYDIIELDTTLKDINNTKVWNRLPNIVLREVKFLFQIIRNRKAKYLFVFLSAGNSYIDKFLPILLAKYLKKKVIVFPRSGHVIRDLDKRKYEDIVKKIFSFSNVIVCQSDFWRDFFLEKGVHASKLIVVENWVQSDTIQKSEKLNFKTFDKDSGTALKMVFVSRIEIDKGVLDVLAVAEKLKNSSLNFLIDIYGAGSYTDLFVKEIEKRNLSHIIKYKGWLKKDNKQEVINQYHVALFLSKTEGYPNALLDYVFSKIPVIATGIPMVKAVGEENILYYSFSDINGLEEAIKYCYYNYNEVVSKSKDIYNIKAISNNINCVVDKLSKEVLWA